jgi:ABC-type multidrug transport system ATPase subunit
LLTYLAELRGVTGLGRAAELAAHFQADLDRPLGELSGGNRQKIGLVQAAFHDPELLVLDEPTSGLDPLMQEAFLEFVAQERERCRTVFLSSHDLDEVQRVCDRVGIIREGRLVAVEDVAEITSRAYRHVTLEFAERVDPDEFHGWCGMSATITIKPAITSATAPSTAAVLRAVIHRGMRDQRRAPLTWGGSLGAMSALMAVMWPSIEGSMDTMMENYPQCERRSAVDGRSSTGRRCGGARGRGWRRRAPAALRRRR